MLYMMCLVLSVEDTNTYKMKPYTRKAETAMRLFFILCFLISHFLYYRNNGYKILIYNSRFRNSHVLFMGRIADTLADVIFFLSTVVCILLLTVCKCLNCIIRKFQNHKIYLIYEFRCSLMRGFPMFS